MSTEKNNDSGTHFLANLSSYAYETDSLPSLAEAKQLLAKEKIDTSDLKSWAAEQLRGANARIKLEAAGQQRSAFLQKFEAVQEKLASASDGLRERVLDKLSSLQNASPDTAMVYCRKFEEAPEEDLAELEAELLTLDLLDEESDK